jgi:hypothetical protein
LGNTLLIFKNTNWVGVWISLAVSVIFKWDKFSRYVGVIATFISKILLPINRRSIEDGSLVISLQYQKK